MKNYNIYVKLIILSISIICLPATANEVEIVQVEFVKKAKGWQVNTTLKHADSGWQHYADAWRVVDKAGNQLGERILLHPHENEQPFTRSLRNMTIPQGIKTVFVEAHDKVHGWSAQKVKVNLDKRKGARFSVR